MTNFYRSILIDAIDNYGAIEIDSDHFATKCGGVYIIQSLSDPDNIVDIESL